MRRFARWFVMVALFVALAPMAAYAQTDETATAEGSATAVAPGSLPNTGADILVPLGAMAASALLLGGIALRRRDDN